MKSSVAGEGELMEDEVEVLGRVEANGVVLSAEVGGVRRWIRSDTFITLKGKA